MFVALFFLILTKTFSTRLTELNVNCADFKLRGFRYKHHTWPAPNRDFIPVTVELIDTVSKWVVKSERHFIQIDIIGGTIRNGVFFRDRFSNLIGLV